MSKLRGYQRDIVNGVYANWNAGHQNVMAVSATGSGKTVMMGELARNHSGYGFAAAHRTELVGQISAALAREDIRHNIIAPSKTIKGIVASHMEEFGRSFYDPHAPWATGSVDTIIRRNAQDRFLHELTKLFIDEGHHVLRDNKWGRMFGMFPNAVSALFTASPIRADGKGLGQHADGIVSALVEGPPMRWLIDNGYLTDYQVVRARAEDLDLSEVHITAQGDYNQKEAAAAIKRSRRIVGDVVETYKRYAWGKLGVTFAVDIEHGKQLTDAYNAAGVPAAFLSADDDPDTRRRVIREFRQRKYWQLVNVDLFGEGFDLPAIECVSMARPTLSWALYAQQWGRALRLMISAELQRAWDSYAAAQRLALIAASEKPFAWIFDHVGNWYAHEGSPDMRKEPWSLDGRERRRSASDAIPMRTCLGALCFQKYERFHTSCPHCGEAAPEPGQRATPEQVDGDMELLDMGALAELRKAVAKVDSVMPALPYNASPEIAGAVTKRHAERQRAQSALRNAIATWRALQDGDDRVNQKRFYLTFGTDLVSACALSSTDANRLRCAITDKLAIAGVTLHV